MQESVFTVEATPLKFGPGASAEVGWDLARLGVTRALVLSDPAVRALGMTERVTDGLDARGIAFEVFDQIRIEPTDASFAEAAEVARSGGFDGFVSVGGGSTMDTAKAANLISTHGGEVIDYVNAPFGGGRKPPGPLRPHVAVPTTSGTGSEATTVAVLDLAGEGVKTGISHRFLRATQAVVDPELTRALPPEVTSAAGLDVVCHAAESYTARGYEARGAPRRSGRPAAVPGRQPDRRPVVGARARVRRALPAPRGGRRRRRRGPRRHDAGRQPGGHRLRIGGRARPHSCAYPIATGARGGYQPARLPRRPPVRAPRALGHRHRAGGLPLHVGGVARAGTGTWPSCSAAAPSRPGEADENTLPGILAELMRDVGAPRGLAELGYAEDDVPTLVQGALKQERLLVGSPREVGADDLAEILRASLRNW